MDGMPECRTVEASALSRAPRSDRFARLESANPDHICEIQELIPIEFSRMPLEPCDFAGMTPTTAKLAGNTRFVLPNIIRYAVLSHAHPA